MAGMIERGNVMDPELAIFLLSELDGMIQSDIMLLGPEEIVSYENQEQELILRKPHDGIYVSFLVAMIRQVQEEFEGYNNAQGIVNEKLETFREWYVAHYDPAETASREYMGAAPGGAGYGFAYLTAYGLAVKRGYSGTEEEWLRSLEGRPGAPGAAARMRFDGERGVIQWGVGGEWYDLFTLEELKDPVVEAMMDEVRTLAEQVSRDKEAANQAANTAAGHATAAGGYAKTAADAAADALGSASRAYASEQNAVTAWGDAQVQAETAQGYALRAEAAANTAAGHATAAGGYAKTAADAAADALGSASRAYASEQNAVTAWGDAQVQAETAEGYALRAEAAAKKAEEAAAGVGTGGNGSGQNVALTSPNGTIYVLAVKDDGTIYTVKQGAEPGDPEEPAQPDEPVEAFAPFAFLQVSDTHEQYSQAARAVLVGNVNALDGVDFVTNSGDLALDQSKDDAVKRTELAEYKANLRDALSIPMYPCVGGHDLCDSMGVIWPEYTGVARLQEIGHKGCVFLLADCLLSGWLDWLEERVAANTGKRIYIYEHHPIENDEFTVGLKPGETRVTWGDNEMRRILRLLRNNHNVIWFTGHTHWPFKTAVNDVYNDEGRMGAVVHTPYLNAYQGWMVEVGEEATMLRGVEFAESGMRYLGEGYDYAIVQDTTDYGEAEIITEGETVAVGGTVAISVYLAAAPRNSQTVHLIAADGIGIDKTELVFTPANYATPQTVTVTGNAAGTGRLTLYSRSRTTVRKVDVVAGAAVTNWFNPAKPLTPLGSYYGTGGSASYQQSNLIPAKTGDRLRTNALGSQTAMRLKMFNADRQYIAEAANNVTAIDYTITEPGVVFCSVVYRGATAGLADTIMVTINQELPSEHVAYNGEPVGYTITNYADPDNPSVVGGYYNESLTQTSKDGVNVSNLFPVTPGDTVYSNGINPDTKPYLYVYDAERTLIERMNIGTGSITNPQAAYAAVCYATGTDNLMVMINQRVPGYYVAGTDVM